MADHVRAWQFSRRRVVWVLLPLWFCLCGCNTFSAIDKSVSPQGDAQRLAEGRTALAEGSYQGAVGFYEAVYRVSPGLPEAVRGYGESLLGVNGFITLTALDVLQNTTGPNDNAPATFRVAPLTRSTFDLSHALDILWTNPEPTPEDRLVRSLARLGLVTRTLRDKYDTNRNGHLDLNDDIDFETRDATTPLWTDIYREYVTGPSRHGAPLTVVADELITGLAGRGTATWTFILADAATAGGNSVTWTSANPSINEVAQLRVGNFGSQNINALAATVTTAGGSRTFTYAHTLTGTPVEGVLTYGGPAFAFSQVTKVDFNTALPNGATVRFVQDGGATGAQLTVSAQVSTTRQVLITPVNRDTVLATLDLDAQLREANRNYAINTASFAATLARIDGLDTW